MTLRTSLPDWIQRREDLSQHVTHFRVVHGESFIAFSMSWPTSDDFHAVLHIAVPFKKTLIEREKTALAVAQALSV